VRPDVKFCGLTRAEDAALAAALGAAYAGVVFAESPRRVSAVRAREIFGAVGSTVRRVGVFGACTAEEIVGVAREVGLDVVQLHGDPQAEEIARVRRGFAGEVWAVVRVAGDELPEGWLRLARDADALVLDSRPAPRDGAAPLGGTGTTFSWDAVAARLAPHRSSFRLVLAGGLRGENVRDGIAALAPDVVDVSSGVESAPGIKDPARMRAFAEAVGLGERNGVEESNVG
jgi:phosphoribosylanthranilate isomerase